MKVQFLRDYGGSELGSKRFAKGDIVDAEYVLERYITNGICVLLPDPEPIVEPQPLPQIKSRPYVELKKHQAKPVVVEQRKRKRGKSK